MNISVISPNSIEAEESILGGIMLDPDAIARVVDILPKKAFFVQAHQIIYDVVLELYRNNQPTDLLTVTCALNDRHFMEKIGGIEKLTMLADRTVSAVNVDRYANLVLDKYQRRSLIKSGNEIVELAKETSVELKEVLEQSEAKILGITVDKNHQFQPELVSNCLGTVLRDLEEGKKTGLSTGLIDLDRMIGGLNKQNLIIVGARAAMGKTWFSLHLANYVAQIQPYPVVFFSAEMSKSELTKRLLSLHTGINSSKLINNELSSAELEHLMNVGLGGVSELKIIIDDTPAYQLTPSKMRSVLRRIRNQYGEVGCVILDYLQKLGNRSAGNRAQVIGEYSGALADMSREFNTPVVALAQINRGVEGKQDKRPLMSDLKDSGDIEQDANSIILLYRDEYYNPDNSCDKGIMEINVAKNRNGETGTCKVLADLSTGTFKNLLSRMG